VRARGFALVEALVALVLALLLLAGLVALFQLHERVARRQIQSVDLQQSLRITRAELARRVRGAGRGGLTPELAVARRGNVGSGERVGGSRTPEVVPGSDVLIVRGVYAGEIVHVEDVMARGADVFELSLLGRTELGFEQDLTDLAEAAEDGEGEALAIIGGDGGLLTILELMGGGYESEGSGGSSRLVLVSRGAGSQLAEGYRELLDPGSGSLDPSGWRRVGLLEEYRYFVERTVDVYGGESRERLARARFYPGSERIHPSSPGGDPLVDNTLDLQVALGFDLDGDGVVREGEAGAARAVDEWLGNDPGDVEGQAAWGASEPVLARISVLLRSTKALTGYVSPAIEAIEDRLYMEPDRPSQEGAVARRFLRARLEATIARGSS
jgi:hypothetical protein